MFRKSSIVSKNRLIDWDWVIDAHWLLDEGSILDVVFHSAVEGAILYIPTAVVALD